MEYKKNDMYQMADQYKKNGWKQVDFSEKTGQIEAEVQLEVEMELDFAKKIPAPPMEEAACGYCITPAMSYVPMQKWNNTYEGDVGLSRGTIFPELDLPFIGEGACDHE